ncbi:MAG: hypothetical protein OXM55_01910 [Bdellovibrionales bacterium]|nr:hypothetical protein [Bdellovibrionales bacterium]
MKNIHLFLFLFFLLIFTSCSNTSVVDSLYFDTCFMDYNTPADLTRALDKTSKELDIEKPSTTFMSIAGCLNYQLGNYELAEQWLIRAFKESKDSDKKSIAASALGIIYLKEFKKAKIKPYIPYTRSHWLGRWMLILYHIDNYRESGYTEHLRSAIIQMEEKYSIEGEQGKTSATDRLLKHMRLISEKEDLCASDPTDCGIEELNDEKRYLFSFSHGYLDMILKKPPFNKKTSSLASSE